MCCFFTPDAINTESSTDVEDPFPDLNRYAVIVSQHQMQNLGEYLKFASKSRVEKINTNGK